MYNDNTQVVPEADLTPTHDMMYQTPTPEVPTIGYFFYKRKANALIDEAIPILGRFISEFNPNWKQDFSEILAESMKNPNIKSSLELAQQYYRDLAQLVTGFVPPKILESLAKRFAYLIKRGRDLFVNPPEGITVPQMAKPKAKVSQGIEDAVVPQ